MSLKEKALDLHEDNQGKLKVDTKVKVETEDDLSLAYSPGVAEPCLEIKDDREKIFDYTNKSNFVAVVSNGSAVLGLGDIGSEASMPVMEGKSVLFKEFGGVDAFPICLDEEDPDKLIETVKRMATTFGGINLEDIKSPECFYIEKRLKEELDIPVFHDDQHGTAIIVLAGLINSLKLVGKEKEDVRVIVNGAGAAGTSVTKLLLAEGIGEVIVVDKEGAIYEGQDSLTESQEELARLTNPENEKGSLSQVIKGADVFIGVSVAGVLKKEMVRKMADDPIIFPMANPEPEIWPEDAFAAGAKIVGTGRSDYPNQVNNVMAFPGLFRGALDVRAKDINEEMKVAASYALAELVSEEELTADYVIPKPFDERVGPYVAAAVAQAAVESGVARIELDYETELEQAKELMA
ncbi:NAD(P)-dependent malic enzyme [Acetohalobium arabaticum]|uniref:Malate dehydrogenase (Oxaloacetate-decarboxylating) n=1 Tax=Acetohalobium arabaticum (strain ATCC 49924 / DSM 5501 / Z-7288) TaxID=574087 RepID=D9QV04_ACEAZ|nr:malic enzyme-like NAD(P)-binding protein [Acetohalobium arabaticum]ADL12063.1 Malate dehydrogenase (oxaloacetate-decarboxylating) [Acetohalobium arabaticum DSM 5501]